MFFQDCPCCNEFCNRDWIKHIWNHLKMNDPICDALHQSDVMVDCSYEIPDGYDDLIPLGQDYFWYRSPSWERTFVPFTTIGRDSRTQYFAPDPEFFGKDRPGAGVPIGDYEDCGDVGRPDLFWESGNTTQNTSIKSLRGPLISLYAWRYNNYDKFWDYSIDFAISWDTGSGYYDAFSNGGWSCGTGSDFGPNTSYVNDAGKVTVASFIQPGIIDVSATADGVQKAHELYTLTWDRDPDEIDRQIIWTPGPDNVKGARFQELITEVLELKGSTTTARDNSVDPPEVVDNSGTLKVYGVYLDDGTNIIPGKFG